MTPSPANTIDLATLLTIDVASEIRKISQAQLHGPWQIPAELVRSRLRAGATKLCVEVSRHRVSIAGNGQRVAADVLDATATLLDPKRTNDDRHLALTVLERSGELALLAVTGRPPRQIRIVTTGHGERTILTWTRGQPGIISRTHAGGPTRTEIILESRNFDRHRIVNWLDNVARFAPAKIHVQGRAIANGFHHAIATQALTAPLQGSVGITTEGDTAKVVLLAHGLVTAHIAIPDVPAFEAAVELGHDELDLSASRLRALMAPHFGTLIDQAMTLLLATGRLAGTAPEPVRKRLAHLTLQCARKRLRHREAWAVPVFRIIDNQGSRRVALTTLQSLASNHDDGRPATLLALYPGQKPARFAIGAAPVVIIDAAERSLVTALLDIRFRPPDPKTPSNSVLATVRRAREYVVTAARDTVSWLRHPMRPTPINEADIGPRERQFLDAVTPSLTALYIPEVRLCHGSGPVRRPRSHDRALLLPRDNKAVTACISAICHDNAWVYPAILMLLEGHPLPPSDTRRPWLRQLAARTNMAPTRAIANATDRRHTS